MTSILILATGTEIPVEPDPERAQENLVALVDEGHDWAFSTITGAWFKPAHVVAILPGPQAKPKTRKTRQPSGASA